jgi:hypothetical protein
MRISGQAPSSPVAAKRWAFVAILAVLPAIAIGHEVRYDGTVAAVEPNRYVAATGIIARLTVYISDRKRPIVFDITQHTRLWRGDSQVTFAAARIQKDESVSVTFSDEEAAKGALDVRLLRSERPPSAIGNE